MGHEGEDDGRLSLGIDCSQRKAWAAGGGGRSRGSRESVGRARFLPADGSRGRSEFRQEKKQWLVRQGNKGNEKSVEGWPGIWLESGDGRWGAAQEQTKG